MKTIIKKETFATLQRNTFFCRLLKKLHISRSVPPRPIFEDELKINKKQLSKSSLKKKTLSTSTEMTTEIRGIRRKRQTSGTNEKRRNINAETFSFSFNNYLIL